VIHQR